MRTYVGCCTIGGGGEAQATPAADAAESAASIHGVDFSRECR
jgi:hypothetical protein